MLLLKQIPSHFSDMHCPILFKLGTSTVHNGIHLHLILFCAIFFVFYFIFIQCRGSYESEHTERTTMGSRRQEEWEREGKNSVEQRHEEIWGRERDGAGYTG